MSNYLFFPNPSPDSLYLAIDPTPTYRIVFHCCFKLLLLYCRLSAFDFPGCAWTLPSRLLCLIAFVVVVVVVSPPAASSTVQSTKGSYTKASRRVSSVSRPFFKDFKTVSQVIRKVP